MSSEDNNSPSSSSSKTWPFAVYSRTMSFLSSREIIGLRRVSKSFQTNTEYNELWEFLVERDYPAFGLQHIQHEKAFSESTGNETSWIDRYEEVMNFIFDRVVNSEIEDRKEFNESNNNKKTGSNNDDTTYDPLVANQHPVIFCRGRLLYCFAGLSVKFPAILEEILKRANFNNMLCAAKFNHYEGPAIDGDGISKSVGAHNTNPGTIEDREIDYESSIGNYKNRNPPATLAPSKWRRNASSQLINGVFELEHDAARDLRVCSSYFKSYYHFKKEQKDKREEMASQSKHGWTAGNTRLCRFHEDTRLTMYDAVDFRPGFADDSKQLRHFRKLLGNEFMYLKTDKEARQELAREKDRMRGKKTNNNNTINQRSSSSSDDDDPSQPIHVRMQRASRRQLQAPKYSRKSVMIKGQDWLKREQDSSTEYNNVREDLVHFVTLYDALYIAYAFHIPRYHYFQNGLIYSYLLNSGSLPTWFQHLKNDTLVSWLRTKGGSGSTSRHQKYSSFHEKNRHGMNYVRITDVADFKQLLRTSFVEQGRGTVMLTQLGVFFTQDLHLFGITNIINKSWLPKFLGGGDKRDDNDTAAWGRMDHFFGNNRPFLFSSNGGLFSSAAGWLLVGSSVLVVGMQIYLRGQKNKAMEQNTTSKQQQQTEKEKNSSALSSSSTTKALLSPLRATQILLVNAAGMITSTTTFAFAVTAGASFIFDTFGRITQAVSEVMSENSDGQAATSTATTTTTRTEAENESRSSSLFFYQQLFVLGFFVFNSASGSVAGVYDATIRSSSSSESPSSSKFITESEDQDAFLELDSESSGNGFNLYNTDKNAESIFKNVKSLVETYAPSFLVRATAATKKKGPFNNSNEILFYQYVVLIFGFAVLLFRGSYLTEIVLWTVAMEAICRVI